MDKTFLSIAATTIAIAAFFPYIHSVLKGKTKPHVFSWLIWGLATLVVFSAQLADGAGVGAWSIGVSGTAALFIAFLAYQRRSELVIARTDWIFFILALLSLPLWYWTKDPLWAVIILTTVDTLGFIPTFRKAYHKPHEEQLLLYGFMSVYNLIAIAALEHYSWATVLFPAVVSFNCVIFVAMVVMRRASARGAR